MGTKEKRKKKTRKQKAADSRRMSRSLIDELNAMGEVDK